MMPAARMSTTGMPATRMAARTTPTGPANMDRPTGTHHDVATSVIPAAPAGGATPAEAATPGITAPVEAWTTPGAIVPAVIAAAVDELSLFDVARNSCRRKPVDRKRIGLTGAQKHERSRGSANPLSHGISFFFSSGNLRQQLPAKCSRCWLDDEFSWQEWQGSNLRPPVLETGALPIELHSCRTEARTTIRAVSSIGHAPFARAKRVNALFNAQVLRQTSLEPARAQEKDQEKDNGRRL